MRKLTPFLFLGCILLALASCQKETSVDTLGSTSGSGNNGGNGGGSNLPGTSNGSEIGTWNLIGVHCTTYQSVESNAFSGNSKVVTVSDYTTDNNTGTIQFDGSTMTATGVSYDMNSMATSYIYSSAGVDTFSFPFSASIPATNSTASYKKIVTDSIYVQSGVFTNLDPSGQGTVQGIASGYKLKWDGDKMYMSMNYQQISNQLVMGITQKTTIRVSSVTTLQKK